MSVISIPTRERAFVGVAGSALVAVVVAGGVATWEGSAPTDTAPIAYESPAAGGTHVSAGGRDQPAPSAYLVATKADADALRMRLGEAEAIRAAMGLPASAATVIVVASAEDERRLMLAINESETIHGGLGLPSTRFADLRWQSLAEMQPTGPCTGDVCGPPR